MIREVMREYFPHWEAPEDNGREWIKAPCPVHDDNNPSSSVSYERDSFVCHGCGYSGDYLKIIEQEEGVTFDQAVRIAARIAENSGVEVPQRPGGKPRRGISRPKRFGSL